VVLDASANKVLDVRVNHVALSSWGSLCFDFLQLGLSSFEFASVCFRLDFFRQKKDLDNVATIFVATITWAIIFLPPFH
jgi:hypothetical protein